MAIVFGLGTYIGWQLPEYNNSKVLLRKGFFYTSIIVKEENRWKILKGGAFPATFQTKPTDARCP